MKNLGTKLDNRKKHNNGHTIFFLDFTQENLINFPYPITRPRKDARENK